MSFFGWRSASFLWTPSSLRAVAFAAACFFSPPAFAAVSTVSMGGFDVVYEDTTGAFISVGFGGALLALGVVFFALIGIAFARYLWERLLDMVGDWAFRKEFGGGGGGGAPATDEEAAALQAKYDAEIEDYQRWAAAQAEGGEAKEGGGAPVAEEGGGGGGGDGGGGDDEEHVFDCDVCGASVDTRLTHYRDPVAGALLCVSCGEKSPNDGLRRDN